MKTKNASRWNPLLKKNSHLNVLQLVSETISSDLVNVVSQPESIHEEEEEIVNEQKDDNKLGFCEIQWQRKDSVIIEGRKFTKKNIKKLDDVSSVRRLSLAFSKIDEELDDDPVKIIPLSSPMRVRSPSQNNAHGSSLYFNIPSESSNNLNMSQKVSQVHLSVPNINPSSTKDSNENLRKTSILSLKSLSLSLRLLKNRARSDSLDMEMGTLETINENRRKSIFQMDIFERNLKRFMSKSNEADFQTYSDYVQQQQTIKNQPRINFKNQKVHARRSSTSDIHESRQEQVRSIKNQPNSHSSSQSNIKHHHDGKRSKDDKSYHHGHAHEKNKQDKTAEVLKEVRKRNMETSKRMSANPRRTSTAY